MGLLSSNNVFRDDSFPTDGGISVSVPSLASSLSSVCIDQTRRMSSIESFLNSLANRFRQAFVIHE